MGYVLSTCSKRSRSYFKFKSQKAISLTGPVKLTINNGIDVYTSRRRPNSRQRLFSENCMRWPCLWFRVFQDSPKHSAFRLEAISLV